MTTESVNSSHMAESLEAIRRELARLSERVAVLETAAGPAAPAAAAPAPAPASAAVSEEILVVLSAAVAAFLGKKAPIRQIRLLGSMAWAQQGRATIQASHTP